MATLKFMIAFLALINLELISAMTRPQLKEAMTGMRKQCQQNMPAVTDDKVDKIEAGVFLEDHDVMCYISCIYEVAQVVKNGRLDLDSVFKQIDVMYPEDMRDAVKATINKCKGVQEKYSDPCEGVFRTLKCMQEADPANFVFP